MIKVIDLNDCEDVVMVSKIIMITENDGLTKIWLKDEYWIYTKESVNEIYEKISNRPDFRRIGG